MHSLSLSCLCTCTHIDTDNHVCTGWCIYTILLLGIRTGSNGSRAPVPPCRSASMCKTDVQHPSEKSWSDSEILQVRALARKTLCNSAEPLLLSIIPNSQSRQSVSLSFSQPSNHRCNFTEQDMLHRCCHRSNHWYTWT